MKRQSRENKLKHYRKLEVKRHLKSFKAYKEWMESQRGNK